MVKHDKTKTTFFNKIRLHHVAIDLRVVFYYKCKIDLYFNKSIKSKTPILQRSKVVHMISYGECAANYISKPKESYTQACVNIYRAALKRKGF